MAQEAAGLSEGVKALLGNAKSNLGTYAEELETLQSNLVNSYFYSMERHRKDVSDGLRDLKTNTKTDLMNHEKQEKDQLESRKKARQEVLRKLRDDLEKERADYQEQTTSLKKRLDAECEVKVKELETGFKAQLERRALARKELIEDVEGDKKKLLEEVVKFESLYKNERRLRRNLAVELMDIKGNIHVFCRVRPLLELEKKSQDTKDAVMYPMEGNITVQKSDEMNSSFEVDTVFRPNSTQEQVYDRVAPFLDKFMNGYNTCIFAYGQTGSGKTYTMDGTDECPGLYRRIFRSMFDTARENTESQSTFKMSILEVYNEKLLDLINYNLRPKEENKWVGNRDVKEEEDEDRREHLEIREGKDGVYVEGLELSTIKDFEEACSLMKKATDNRITASHNLNEHSSRSHLVISIYLQRKPNKGRELIVSRFSLVDLAGSERLVKTEAVGKRLKEAQAINTSLSALGDVVHALGGNSSFIPYRNSKLTMMLKDSLQGNSKVLMFANVSPIHWNAVETISTLNFAERCRAVCLGQAMVNKRPSRG